jgi:hypothetical protein
MPFKLIISVLLQIHVPLINNVELEHDRQSI